MGKKWVHLLFAAVLVLALTQPVFAQKLRWRHPGVQRTAWLLLFRRSNTKRVISLLASILSSGDAFARKMGLKASPLNMDFKGLIPALQGKRIDMINSAMYIKPERAEQVDLIPYLEVGEEVMVKKGDPKKVPGVDDLCGKSVAVTLGAIEEIYARDFSKKCTEAEKPAIDVKTFPTAPDSVTAVQQDRSYAFFTSTPGCQPYSPAEAE